MAISSIAERRASPRRVLILDCTLSRNRGSAIRGRTLDISDGGMRVCTQRPLAVDEVLAFDLKLEDGELRGQCRVLRQMANDTYAVRFEQTG